MENALEHATGEGGRRAASTLAWLAGGGEMGERIRAFDWTETPLGPPETWPQSLRTAIRIMLTSRQPFWIGWGPELTYFYNDPYQSIIGGKHPQALGQPTSVVWREIWDVIAPMLSTAMQGDEGTYVESQLLIMERYGYPEETYYTFSYSPIPDDGGGTGGIICANTDDTQRVLSERQLALLRQLAADTADARTAEEACRRGMEALRTNPRDLPFAMVYLADPDDRTAFLAAACGIQPGHAGAPERVPLDGSPWPLEVVLKTQTVCVVDNLAGLFPALPTGAWQQAPTRAAVLPIPASGGTGRTGVLVVGLNPFRQFDEDYRSFLGLVAGQIAASAANAEAYEQERRRAEALAEIDRAKTVFFSNVSHEFRTPLTLLQGPLEDLLQDEQTAARAEVRERLTVAHRNSLRLLKLVNTLLDFSRIEAGRVQACYEPTDLGALTTDLAATFQDAMHRAGLRFRVECASFSEPVYVDREMWEKVVLNLVSNAFKFTLEGEIAVTLRQDADSAVLTVSDTGTGIPAEALPHIFERFHRVEGARARTHEGTGIGLALVQELVKLHGGAITAASVYGEGTRFTIRIPLGSAHLPADRIGASRTLTSTALGANPFVEEALRWLPGETGEDDGARPGERSAGAVPGGLSPVEETARGARVLVADDNADMRQYVQRLLTAHYEVEAVANGEAALAAARQRRPDLVLTDVMMPRLDGFGLLRELRADPSLRTVPVILLSARAGEETRVEGLEAGADDYLIKPFSARELVARVGAHVALARVRREAESILESITDGFFSLDAEWRFTYLNPTAERIMGQSAEELIGKNHWEVYPATLGTRVEQQYRRTVADGTPVAFENHYEPWDRWFSISAYPARGGGLAVFFQDITDKKQVAAALAERQAELQEAQRLAHIGSWHWDAETDATTGSDELYRIYGLDPAKQSFPPFKEQDGWLYPHESWQQIDAAVEEAVRTGAGYELDVPALRNGSPIWVTTRSEVLRDGEGRVAGLRGTVQDITERKQAEQRITADLEATMLLRELATVGSISGNLADDWLRKVVETGITITGADRGNIQLLDARSGALTIAAQCGFEEPFLKFFAAVDRHHAAACAAAIRAARRMIVEDVTQSELFSGQASLGVLLDAGVRAVQSTPLVSSTGRVLGMVSTHWSRPHRLDERELRFLDLLARQAADVIERTQVEEALREADRRKDEFLAMLAHELRNPLAPIRTAARILQLQGSNDPRLERNLAIIERQVAHMARLLDDLLDVSRITRGQVTLQQEPLDLESVVQHAVESCRPAIEEQGHVLVLDLSPQPLSLSGDRVRLEQVVTNLVNNAAKYTDPGGTITVKTRRNGQEAVLCVEDTGRGIAASLLPHVFDLFTQEERSLDRSQGGLGIGLTLVKTLVELHGGQVTAYSEGPGKGSQFQVRLPLWKTEDRRRKAEGTEHESLHPSSFILQPSRRVLVVDDNQDGAQALAELIRLWGYCVQAVYDGLRALEVAREFRPQAIFLDIGMPGIDGYEVARRLRSEFGREGMALVALTGYGREEDQEESRAAGFDYHLTKPVNLDEVERTLETLFGKEETG